MEGIYRRLLVLYPRSYRREYGEAMVETFALRASESADGGRLARLRFLAWEIGGLIRSAARQRLGGTGFRSGGASIDARDGHRAPFWPPRRSQRPVTREGSPRTSPGDPDRRPHPPRRSSMPPVTRDLKVALRGLRKRPTYALVSLLTIAVAVAANTAIFSVANGVLLQPLPFRDADRLVAFDVVSTRGYHISLSIPNYRDWVRRSRVFESFGASAGWGMTLTGRGQAEVLGSRAVLGEFFATLGLEPLAGRVIPPAETEPGAEAVAVLGHAFWQREFGGDPEAALGETLVLDDRPHVVVGILPPGVGYPSERTDLYFPMGSLPGLPWDDRESSFGTRALALLAPGVDMDRARSDMARVHREIETAEGEPVARPEVLFLSELMLGEVRSRIWLVMGAVTFVLLIAAANVANLQLARGEDRRREIALRTALGATRGTVVRELLGESLVLAAGGGLLGLALARGMILGLVPLLPDHIPPSIVERIGIDGTVLAFTLGIVALAGLIFGLPPALRASRSDPAEELKAGGRAVSGGSRWLRRGLVVAEVALSLVLLAGAGLMIRSVGELQRVDKGFEPDAVLTARVRLSDQRYPSVEAWRGFYDELQRRADALPGVRASAVTLLLPLTDRSWEMGVLPEGVPPEQQRDSVLLGIVSEDYFEVLGVPVLDGRAFTAADRDGGPLVAIIDETLAEKYWPGQDPIGKRLFFEVDETGSGEGAGSPGEHHQPDAITPVYRTVVGIARNVRHYELESPSRIQLYIPFRQTRGRFGMSLNVALATEVPPTTLVEPLRRVVAGIDPDVALTDLRPLQDYVDEKLTGSRTTGGLLSVLAVLAMALAGIGIFGVVSYSVARRTREIGVRIALGADARKVLGLVLREGLTLTGIGVVFGLLAATALTRTLTGFLYGVSPLDPVVYGSVVAFLATVAAVASWMPARRATRVDPVTVLDEEV